MTGITPVELVNEEPDGFILYLLDYFYELSLSRQVGMVACPILYGEIESWCRLTDTILENWEIQAIKRLDMIWLKVNSE